MTARDIAIIGYAETKLARRSGKTAYGLAGEVLDLILTQTGCGKGEIDGLVACRSMSEAANPFWSAVLADHLGLALDWCETVDLGGASFAAAVGRAVLAIRGRMCSTVLVIAADARSSGDSSDVAAYRQELVEPLGLLPAPGAFGMLTNRYAAQYALDERALAKLVVTQRHHALANDNACEALRKPLMEADYLASRMVSAPIRLLDCVMTCDGANGVLVTTTMQAKARGARCVHPIAYAERVNDRAAEPLPDVTRSVHTLVAAKALSQAGLALSDIGMLQLYDDFPIAELLQLEHMGFCAAGDGSRFILETDLSHAGNLPLNTGGGQLSAGQPGLAGGGIMVVEAMRQLCGEGGARQAKDPGTVLVTGLGVIDYAGLWAAGNVLLLERGL